VVVVANDSQSEDVRRCFSHFKHRLLDYSGHFNLSSMNNYAVKQTDSPWLLFLNDQTEVFDGDWLTTMAEHVQRSEVGAVGPRLLCADDTVQHGGIVVGVGEIAEHAFRGLPAEAPGVCRQLQATRNYSAVTGACLLTRRDVFDEVGGFDESLPLRFGDVDLCLKMRRAGYLIVCTPFPKLVFSKERGFIFRLGNGNSASSSSHPVYFMGRRICRYLQNRKETKEMAVSHRFPGLLNKLELAGFR
jgi:hypothetical protein